MVDSIKGSGKRIIITSKPKPKDSAENKDKSFDKTLKDKTSSSEKTGTNAQKLTPAQNNLKIIQQQQLNHMQRIAQITRQVQNGTYKPVDASVLAEKIFQVIADRKTREKFIKKLVQEESEKLHGKDRPKISDLELKKLVFMIREAQDEPFDDPELEKMLAEFA